MIKINEYEIEIIFYSYQSMNNIIITRNYFDDIEVLQNSNIKKVAIELENKTSEFLHSVIETFTKKYSLVITNRNIIDCLIESNESFEAFEKDICTTFDLEVED